MARLVIGVCAMDAKTRSKPMRSILSRLLAPPTPFECIIFGDKTILDDPPSAWPICDFLIAFHSTGFPLAKAIEYVNLRRPFCVNDVRAEQLLRDRRMVLAVLDACDVRTGRRLWTTRDGGPLIACGQGQVEALMERLSGEFNINFFSSAFSEILAAEEMPVGALGGGRRGVKVGKHVMARPFVEKPVDSEDHNIYIYHEDGVRRLFRKIGNKSSEWVADPRAAIRADGDYIYEEYIGQPHDSDAMQEDIKLYAVGPYYVYGERRKAPTVDGRVERNADGKEVRHAVHVTAEEEEWTRRICMAFGQTVCGFDIIRRGQKSYVIDVNGWSFVKGNEEYFDNCARILKDTFLRVATRRLSCTSAALQYDFGYGTLKSRLPASNRWRLISYISIFRHADRTPKQKFKTKVKDASLMPPNVRLMEILGVAELRDFIARVPCHYPQLLQVLRRHYKVPGSKVQLKRKSMDSSIHVAVKWGGEFTHAGRHQAREAGEWIRSDLNLLLSQTGQREHQSASFLNRDNVRVRASKERRVVATASVFAKALLATAELPDDLIRVDLAPPDVDTLLEGKECIDVVKERIKAMLVSGRFRDKMGKFVLLFSHILANIQTAFDTRAIPKTAWCCADSPKLFRERWSRLHDNFAADQFDPARIFDLYDSLKYDLLHHRCFLEQVCGPALPDLVELLQVLFMDLQRVQYGQGRDEQLAIARSLSTTLLMDIVGDLEEAKGSLDFTSASFYFTKEANLHGLHTLLHYSVNLPYIGELDYLSQIDIEVFGRGLERSVRVGVRPGAHAPSLTHLKMDEGPGLHALAVSQRRTCTDHYDLDQAIALLGSVLH